MPTALESMWHRLDAEVRRLQAELAELHVSFHDLQRPHRPARGPATSDFLRAYA